MNLYLVSQNVNNDWDTYDSFVVAANNEYEARHASPSGYIWKDDCWNIKYYDGSTEIAKHKSWCHPKDVVVELLGVADSSLVHSEVVCSSYNAG